MKASTASQTQRDGLCFDSFTKATGFFRNPSAFDALKRTVFPTISEARRSKPARIWIAGCATGQEAYSIAMSYIEFSAETKERAPMLQMFATDLDTAHLGKARRGLYAKDLLGGVSKERLQRFFVEEDGGYRVSKELREMCVFARQNLLVDPPFSHLDLISCRNLLTSSDSDLQKIIETFHYALSPKGYLLLAAAKSIGSLKHLFEFAEKRQRNLFKKKPRLEFHLPVSRSFLPAGREGDLRPATAQSQDSIQREADRIVVKRYSPPGVLINADLQIIQFRGGTSAYLEPPTGKARFDLLKMAKGWLVMPLRKIIEQARKEGKSVRKERIPVNRDGRSGTINVEVIPMKNLRERCFLILFEDAGKGILQKETKETKESGKRTTPSRSSSSVKNLERELSETREYLQSVREQHDAAQEELQIANEEIQSANEELQSFNEELETSKEELQSANEELISANEELEQRVAERTKELDSASKRLQKLAQQLLRLQENERLSIMTELHEEILQLLVALKMLLSSAENVSGKEKNVWDRSALLVAKIQARVETLSSSLRPNVPEFLPLRTALEGHFRKLREEVGLKVHFECQGLNEGDFGPEIRHALFRITQDALTNVVRHAHVRKAKVSLSQTNGDVSLEISDRGAGFAADAPRANSSHGISGIEERVLLLGGRFFLATRPGDGTRIGVTLPCSSPGKQAEGIQVPPL